MRFDDFGLLGIRQAQFSTVKHATFRRALRAPLANDIAPVATGLVVDRAQLSFGNLPKDRSLARLLPALRAVPRSLQDPTARDGGKWLVVRPAPRSLSCPSSSLHFARNSSPRTGCPYTTILERSPRLRGAAQNRRADVARNTLLAGGPVREDLAGLLLPPFLLLLPVD